MADPEPNDKVNLAGSGVLLHVLRASDGRPIPLVGDASGAITMSEGATGTGFAVQPQTIPTTAAQLVAASWPRGFAVQNLDTTNPIYIGPTAAVTSASGWQIEPGGREVFPLPNSGLLYAIATGGSVNIRIGGVV